MNGLTWRVLATMFLVALCLLGACGETGVLTPEEGARIVREEVDLLLLDVRLPEEFATGHYHGALNIPVDDLAARAEELPSGRPVLVYCAVGKRAWRAQMLLWRLRPDIGPVFRIAGRPLFD